MVNKNTPVQPFLSKGKQIGTSLVVSLGAPKVIKTIPALNITVSEIKITQIIDSSVNKTVTAYTDGQPSEIVLWSGAAYDAIGQWTDTDVINRIKELYK